MGGKGGGRIGRCELHAHEQGGEADKGGYRGAGIGAPGARHVGEHVVVRALEGDAPLFVVAEFFKGNGKWCVDAARTHLFVAWARPHVEGSSLTPLLCRTAQPRPHP